MNTKPYNLFQKKSFRVSTLLHTTGQNFSTKGCKSYGMPDPFRAPVLSVIGVNTLICMFCSSNGASHISPGRKPWDLRAWKIGVLKERCISPNPDLCPYAPFLQNGFALYIFSQGSRPGLVCQALSGRHHYNVSCCIPKF